MRQFSFEKYLQQWEAINQKMVAKNFLWGTLFQDGEWNQYMSFDLYKMTQSQWNLITKATSEIAHILQNAIKSSHGYYLHTFYGKIGIIHRPRIGNNREVFSAYLF